MLSNTIIKIGNQPLLPIADHYRFRIYKTMPERGFKFKFGIREKIIDYVISKGKHLEVVFPEFPSIILNENPIRWKALGKRQKQVGLWKDNPFWLYWYYVDFKGDLTQKKNKNIEGQKTLFV